ncbi:MAG: hypothetical protein GXP32_07330 [Kiritimatiellaeota bacterium]|nr:hypothetical protein [Kiritimatiellota bacterium]
MKRCPKCELDNFDHLALCVECGADLNAETQDIELETDNFSPPRAGRLQICKSLFYQIQRNLGSLTPRVINADISETHTAVQPKKAKSLFRTFFLELREVLAELLPALLSVIPGLGHIYRKRLKRAGIFAAIYLISLALGLFFYGRAFSNICFGVMLTAHAVTIYDSLPISLDFFNSFRARMTTMVLIFMVIILGYRALYNSITERVNGAWVAFNAPPAFSSGDFILISKSHAYKRGDIIFYHDDGGYINLEGQYEYAYMGSGLYAERVLGLPGESVEIKDDKIWIDSKPLPENIKPLMNVKMRNMRISLAKTEYFVYLSTTSPNINTSTSFLLSHNTIAYDNIRGKVFMVYAPLSRMKFIKQQEADR